MLGWSQDQSQSRTNCFCTEHLAFIGMADESCVTRFTSAQLIEAAKFSQTRAQGQEATTRDSFLVMPSHDDTVSLEHPNEVRPLSVRKSQQVVSQLKSTAVCSKSGGRSCLTARQVFSVQTSSTVVCTRSPEFSSSLSLPGNVPVVDHLYVWAREESAWSELLPAISDIRDSRLPVKTMGGVNKQVEVTFGVTSNSQIIELTEQLIVRRRSVKDSHRFCRFAADTESIMVPVSALEEFRSTGKPVSFVRPILWSRENP
jgi:hypothetical protein